MRLLSLDQATKITGYALFDDKKLIKYGTIVSNDRDAGKRFSNMIRFISDLIVSEQPDKVVFENVQFQASIMTTIILARLQGAIIATCLNHGIPYEMLLPTEWRKTLEFKQGKQIKRNELKDQVHFFIEKKYGIDVKEDCAEGIAIGVAYLKNLDMEQKDL